MQNYSGTSTQSNAMLSLVSADSAAQRVEAYLWDMSLS